ncbi:helix-turn-helix transcriptional regulator [Salmonella enterica]|nr:helix-turn-helix transcriptional regulator [Salmonella enterica]EGC1081555.1 helix-turn-helix transcriptional regulator [Salmonella enterica]EGI8357133.1 helix-turn-helix transcriptional regulator [Salmonella enterica]EIB3185926.1 helix-turn-helix transcriptional regulator [Salmonella enterica]EIK1908100.1 helix-turn-helix transcriptional regulator [Salmonella enterica]
MLAIPFPWFTLSILLILLLKVCRQRPAGYRNSATFIAGCSLLILMSALRWQFDLILLRQLQSVIAIPLPPLAWHCFACFTGLRLQQKVATFVGPPILALVLNLTAPATTDVVLMLLYVGYGCVLIRTALLGSDTFIFRRLSDSASTSSLAFIAGCFLCFSGLTDLAIALNFHFCQGQQAPQMVVISQAILLPFVCFAIVGSGRPSLPAGEPVLPPEERKENNSEALLPAYQRVNTLISEQNLYLNPDLTLNTLARKTGVPARQISKAVNLTRGCNVSQWINGLRIDYAQQLLRNTDLPVTEVMLEAGFATKSNFHREFLRISGMTPTDYRRAAAESREPD